MEQQDKKDAPRQTITIDIPAETEKGVYSNQIIIGHSQKEFILDFGLLLPPGKKIKVVSRIITTPTDAKSLLLVLNENISRYEKVFGSIQRPMPNKKDSDEHSIH